MWIDTHSHAHLGSPAIHSAAVLLASTHQGDWHRVAEYKQNVIARAYGIHPWWAETAEGPWLQELEELLRADPSALVGEIGLDGLRGGDQTSIFRQQFKLAAQYQRPITVHCVKAFGALRNEIAAGPHPPAMALHSFGGSIEFARDLQRLCPGLYFGISETVNGRKNRRHKQLALINALPDDAILLETDLEDPSLIDAHLLKARDLVAEAKQWSLDDTFRICYDNARAFFSAGATSSSSATSHSSSLLRPLPTPPRS